MPKITKKIYWIAGTVAALFVILAAGLFVAESYINRETFKNKIKAKASSAVGGSIGFQRLSLSILPRPTVAAGQGKISIPGVFEGSFEELAVSPEILPLFKGSLVMDNVRLDSPNFIIDLPETSREPEKKDSAFTVEGLEQAFIVALKKLVSIAPGLETIIKNGQIELVSKNRDHFLLKNLNIDAELFPESVGLDIVSEGNSWKKIAIKGRINPNDLKGRGRIEVEGIHPKLLLQYLTPKSAENIIESDLNLNIGFRTDGLKSFYGDIYSSGSRVILKKGKERFEFKGKGMKGTVKITEDLTSFTISELNLGNPELALSGKFAIGQNLLLEPLDMSAKTGLEIKATDVDVNALRELTLALGGDVEVVRGICEIVKGGRVTAFSLRSLGETVSDLGNFANIEITGTMENGELFVPGVELDLTRVNGNVVIKDGILNGENLDAVYGKTKGDKGKIGVGLMEGEAPFYLELMLDADLSSLPPILTKVVDDPNFLYELSKIENFTGNASGKLVLEGTTHAITTKVDVSKFSIAAKYQRVPFDIRAKGGSLSYRDTGIAIKNVNANIGQSSLSIQSAEVNWRKNLNLAVQTGSSTFICNELVPWVESFHKLPEKIKIGTVIESSEIRFAWDKGTGTELSGAIKFDSGVSVAMDMAFRGDDIAIKKLSFNDKKSDAVMSFLFRPDEFNMGFKGHLEKSTLEKIVTENRFVKGGIEGDIDIKVPYENLTGISARGALSGNKIKIPAGELGLVDIKSFSIRGKGNDLRIDEADMAWAGTDVAVQGHVLTGAETVSLDLDVSSDEIIWKKIKNHLPDEKDNSRKKDKRPPIDGVIRCKLEKFQLDDYVWTPMYADVTFDEFRAEIFLKKAKICGISTPGTITLSPEGTGLVFKPVAKNLSLADSLKCLLEKDNIFTGTYTLNSHMFSKEISDDLIKSLSGTFEFNALDGRVYKASVIGKILSVINIREIGEINKDGFSYKSIYTNGYIENGRLVMDEGVLDGDSINITWKGSFDLNSNKMDIEMFVAPLSIINIIAVPVRVTGPINNPMIIPLHPTMVGSGLMNLMKKTVKFPFEVIKPVLSGE